LIFQINAVLLKNVSWCATKKLFSLVIIRNVFDQQISILERFLKDYVMLESGVIMLKQLALPAQD